MPQDGHDDQKTGVVFKSGILLTEQCPSRSTRLFLEFQMAQAVLGQQERSLHTTDPAIH